MTTGATGQLGLALPVQGELSGTWGDTVNNGITEYTNIAIAGTLTLTDDGAVTLANTTGDASASNITSSLTGAGTVTAQFAIVKVTGTLTAAKVITGPSYSKTYVVDNTTATYAVTFKASGQTGVSIVAGEKATVYYNGTDYVKVASSTADGVTTFSAGTTGFTPSTATSGAVTLAGTLATTNGGTGLTSFTSGGVVYASSTSALATGSALTFDGNKLAIQAGSATANRIDIFNDTGNATLRVGYDASNNYTITRNTADANIYLNATQSGATQVWQLAGTEGMRLTSTGLGIGTSSPSSKLQVTSANGALTLDSGTGETHYIDITHKGSYSDLGGIRFRQGSTTYGNNQILFRAMDSGGTVQTVMTLNGDGNLGLGVTPSAWVSNFKAFQVGTGGTFYGDYNNTTSYFGNNAYFNGTNWKYVSSSYALYAYQDRSAGRHVWAVAASGTAGNNITWTEAMNLDASGYLSGVWADKVTALGNSGTATTITCTSGNVFTATLTGNCTFTLSAPSTTTANTATSFTLILTNDGTAGRTVAFSGGTFKYPGGSVTRTTTANAVDIWFFFSPDGGTTWYVSIPMANLS